MIFDTTLMKRPDVPCEGRKVFPLYINRLV